tara:strand:- start:86 stop:385 length:300 start_codon:yes stop_codon:yes gene_type:complete
MVVLLDQLPLRKQELVVEIVLFLELVLQLLHQPVAVVAVVIYLQDQVMKVSMVAAEAEQEVMDLTQFQLVLVLLIKVSLVEQVMLEVQLVVAVVEEQVL